MMLPEVDWSRLYYALVMVHSGVKGSTYKILGMGTTISKAKINGMEYISMTREYKNQSSDTGYKKFMNLDLYTRAYTGLKPTSTYYTVMYVEAKIYEYSKIWDIEKFEIMIDPTVRENVLRFVRLKKSVKTEYKIQDESYFKYIE